VSTNFDGIGGGPAGIDPHVAADRPIQHRQSLQERPDAGLKYRIVRRCGHEHAVAPPMSVMNSRRLMMIVPANRTEMQDIELAEVSQRCRNDLATD
jgi:hypothetical protein